MSADTTTRTIKIDGRIKGDIADHATFLSRNGSDTLDVYPVSKSSEIFPHVLRSSDHLRDELNHDGKTIRPVILHSKKLQGFLPAYISEGDDEIVIQIFPQADAIAAAEIASSLADNFLFPKPDIMDFFNAVD